TGDDHDDAGSTVVAVLAHRRSRLALATIGLLGAATLASAGAGAHAQDGAATEDPALTMIHADEAWQVTRGDPSTRVAVIDTAIDYTHPDLQGRMVGGVDLGDGDDDPMDEIGHGTAVAGIIATVCPRCSLLGVKIFNEQALATP